MILAVDVETYKYDEKEGVYVPNLNAKDFTLGCILVDGKKNPFWFTKADDMFNFILKFVQQRKKEGHNCYIYGHKHSYDLYSYAQNYIQRTDLLDVKSQDPLLAFLDETGILLDTRAFFKSKLEDVGRLIGLPKLEMPPKLKA